MLRTSVCAFVLFSAVELIWAEETVTVKTEDTGAALVNPRMGWTIALLFQRPAELWIET